MRFKKYGLFRLNFSVMSRLHLSILIFGFEVVEITISRRCEIIVIIIIIIYPTRYP
jgi:hypothetical protein